MPVIIHQSLYGDLDGGYALLKTTMLDKKMAKKIGNSTDLSDRPVPGILWQPAIRGFSFGEYYLVMRTYNTPHIRMGRVFSHVLLIEKKDLAIVRNLGQLFSLFKVELDLSLQLTPFEYEALNHNQEKLARTPRIEMSAEGLVKGKTVVWIGQSNFEDLIQTLWWNIWPKAKPDFQFGIQFNPTAVQPSKINVFCTPESLSSKWNHEDFWIVRDPQKATQISISAHYILGDPEGQPLGELVAALGKELSTVHQLTLLEKGLETFNSLDKTSDFNEVFSLLNILYAVNISNTSLIARVLKKLATVLPAAKVSGVNALRKLKFIQSGPGSRELILSFEKWCQDNLLVSDYSGVNETYKLILNLKQAETESWWSRLIYENLSVRLANWKAEYRAVFWKWLEADPDQILWILGDLLIQHTAVADDLGSVIPKKISQETITKLKIFAAEHGLLVLHAYLLLHQVTPDKVISGQLAIDKDSNKVQALEVIANKITPELFIAGCLQSADQRLIRMGGLMIKRKRSLLKKFNVVDLTWQKLWLETAPEPHSLKEDFGNPHKEIVFPALDRLLAKQPVLNELMAVIAGSEYADVSDYPNRAQIWDLMDQGYKNIFVRRTVTGMLDRSVPFDESIEKELLDALNSKEVVTSYLERNKDNIGPVIQYFEQGAKLTEKSLQDYLYYYQGDLSAVNAEQLGKLVYKRKWEHCLGIIKERARHNQHFKIAFQECTSMLDFWSYAKASFHGLITKAHFSELDWWDSFEQLAPQLYPEGPTQSKVWKKAGGEESDLLHKGDGKEIWHDAINKLKIGRIKNSFLESLLARMSHDFPYNESLNILTTLRNKL